MQPHSHLARTPGRRAHDIACRTVLAAPSKGTIGKVASHEATPVASTARPNVTIDAARKTVAIGSVRRISAVQTARCRGGETTQINLPAKRMTRVSRSMTLPLLRSSQLIDPKCQKKITYPAVEPDNLQTRGGVVPSKVWSSGHRRRALRPDGFRGREQDSIAREGRVSRLILLRNGRAIQSACINPKGTSGRAAAKLEATIVTGSIDRSSGVVLDTREKRSGRIVGVTISAHGTCPAIRLRSRRVGARGYTRGRSGARARQLGVDEAASLAVGTRSRHPESLKNGIYLVQNSVKILLMGRTLQISVLY